MLHLLVDQALRREPNSECYEQTQKTMKPYIVMEAA